MRNNIFQSTNTADRFSIFSVSGGTPLRWGNFQSIFNDRIFNYRVLILLLIGLMGVGMVGIANGEEVVRVRIEGEEETYFDGGVAIEGCEITDESGIGHEYEAVAACVIKVAADAAGIDLVWQDFGFGLLLAQIGEERNADDWSSSWGFWVDYDPASVGLSDYVLVSGEEILVAYSGWPGVPLRVTGSESVNVDDEVQLVMEQRWGEYDNSFNWIGEWKAAAGLSVDVGGQEFMSDEDGVVVMSGLETGDWPVKVEGIENMIRSREWMLNVMPVATVTPAPTATPTPMPSATPIPAIIPTAAPVPQVGVEQVSDNEMRAAVVRALAYLRSEQDSDGGIDGAMVSGWAAMAFGADNIRASEVKAGNNSLADYLMTSELTRVTDKERQIMGLRAGGINPRNWQGRDLAGELRSELTDRLGADEFINDEVFGLLALMASEISVDDKVVRDLVGYLTDRQESGGNWETMDMTAATMQALQSYRARGGRVESEVLKRARTYLKDQQGVGGGWGGNSATTAWVMMAISAMGEDQNNWVSSEGMTPGAALLKYQAGNGGFGWQFDSGESAFMTAYAVPALLGKSWVIASLSVETSEFYVESITKNTLEVATMGGEAAEVVGQIAGIETVNQVMKASGGQEKKLVEEEEEVERIMVQESNVEGMSDTVPVHKIDRGFLWVMFGLANAGVGGTITRLVMKIV